MDAEAAEGAVLVIQNAEEDAVYDVQEFFTGPAHGSGSGERDEGLEPFPVACRQFVKPASLRDDQVAAPPVRKHVHAALRQGAEQIREGLSVHTHEPVLLHFGRIGAEVLCIPVRGHERDALSRPVGSDPRGLQHDGGCPCGRDVAGFLESVHAVFPVNSYFHISFKEGRISVRMCVTEITSRIHLIL